MQKEGIREKYSFASWCSQAQFNNLCSLVLTPWRHCSFTSLTCRLTYAFLFNSLFLILCVLFDMVTLLISIFGPDSDYLCIHFLRHLLWSTSARSSSSVGPQSCSDARWLSVSIGYRCPMKTKVDVQTGLELPRRQISLTIYLHYLYFSLMWGGEGISRSLNP